MGLRLGPLSAQYMLLDVDVGGSVSLDHVDSSALSKVSTIETFTIENKLHGH